LHYPELISDFIERLNSNETLPDLYLSATSEEGASKLLADTIAYRGNVIVRQVPNVGRDIASMFMEFSDELQAYDLVGHLHGKKSFHISSAPGEKDFVATWREFLLENLVGGKIAALDAIACRFAGDEQLGMVFPEDPFICGWGKNKEIAKRLARRMGIDDLPDAIEFPVGNMFYFRPEALGPLFSAGFSYEDFPREPLPDDGTILHALERLTPLVCSSQGFEWLTTEVEGVTR
jgi:lipopolysaccharide biosynthesis protein